MTDTPKDPSVRSRQSLPAGDQWVEEEFLPKIWMVAEEARAEAWNGFRSAVLTGAGSVFVLSFLLLQIENIEDTWF